MNNLFYTSNLNTNLSKIGLTWRPAFIIYKDNDTYLYSIKENIEKTIYTFTSNYNNCMVFEEFDAAYNLVCVYNNSPWVTDENNESNSNAINKLFIMPVEIKGNKNIKIKHPLSNNLYDTPCRTT